MNTNLIDRHSKSQIQPDSKNQDTVAVNMDINIKACPELDKSVKNDYTQVSKAVALVQPTIQPFLSQVNHYDKTVNAYIEAARQKNRDDIKDDLTESSTGTIPFARRFFGIWYAVLAHDYVKAAGKAAILINNIPEDTRDIGTAINELRGIKSDTPNSFQIPFSNFRGTFLNKPLRKMIMSKNKILRRVGIAIHNADKTFDKTWIGREILNLVGKKDTIFVNSKRLNIYGKQIKAQKIIGNFLAEFTGKTFLRIPVLTVYLFYIFELPAIYKAFKISPKEGFKQIAKSIMSVNTVISGTAVGGALGSYKGTAAGLAGMSIGSYAGFKASKYINKQIDKM